MWFRRASVVVTGVAAVCGMWFVVPAGAAAPNRTTITITCDRTTTSATAVVTLYDRVDGTQVGEPTTVACGTSAGLDRRARVVVEHPSAVGATTIDGYDVSSDGEMVSCEGAGMLTFELACTGVVGSGAKITVR